MCLSSICSLLWRNVFQILGPFFSWAICCLFCCIFHFLESSLLSAIRFAHVFSHSVSCLCPLLIVSFETQKFNCDEVEFISFFLMSGVLLMSYIRNHCLFQSHEELFLCFSLKSFIVIVLKFRCVNHLS